MMSALIEQLFYAAVLAYFAVAFVAMQPLPHKWSFDARMGFTMATVLLTLILCAAVNIQADREEYRQEMRAIREGYRSTP